MECTLDEYKRCKERLRDGAFTPLEFIQGISHNIGHINADNAHATLPHSDLDKNDEIELAGTICVVHLSIRTTTCISIYCRHLNSCKQYSATIFELG